MARHCVRWASGRKKAKGKKRKGAHCAHGRVKTGPRKGRCRKQKLGHHAKWRKAGRSGASYMAGL